MNTVTNKSTSTVIVSVYVDYVALRLILKSLQRQTSDTFEVIVSEDGESEDIKKCVNEFSNTNLKILHLTQKDIGFRKNIALNRAIKASNTDHLIFIDGDCVLHPCFVEAHQSFAKPGIACTGRRLELGENISKKIRENKIKSSQLTNRFLYYINILPLILDKAKNIESGIYSKLLHKLTENKEIRLLGCNFSCHKQDLYKINGFNEEYMAAGIGEDSDIDWRLTRSGVKIKNVKFSAIQYHLYHPRTYSPSEENEEIFNRTIKLNIVACRNGILK